MIAPVIGTVGTRVGLTVANLLVVVAAGHYLGASGVGTISLLVLGITFILLLNNVVGGGGLVYLTPRYGASALQRPSYAWALVTALVAWGVLRLVPLVPAELAMHTVSLALLQSFCSIHFACLLGRQRIGLHNGLLLLQGVLLLSAFVVLLRNGTAGIMDYVHAAYFAHGSTAILSGLLLGRDAGGSGAGTGTPVVDLLRQGGAAQAANGLQLLNYRLAYYLIERWAGTAALGTYAVTTQLAESAWLVPKSLGLVLYARVSNMAEADRQRDLTLTAMKASVAVATLVIGLLLLLPDAVYRWVFGPEIGGLAPLILLLVPGLLAMSASQALSHFLSGSGRVYHNVIGSGLGTVATIALGFTLIPRYGLPGAACTASVAYTLSVLYQFIIFRHLTHARLHQFLPDASDMQRLWVLWNRLLGR